jgi:hypothetical protein
MRQAPSPEDLLPMVNEAKLQGRNHIRFLVAPSSRFLDRFPRIWDGVSVRVVGRQMETIELENGERVVATEKLVVEAHITTVRAALDRQRRRALWELQQPMAVNRVKPGQVVVGPR